MLSKLAKIPWQVSGRKKTWELLSSIAPTKVLNIKLNGKGLVIPLSLLTPFLS
jgi:hypothetical protein